MYSISSETKLFNSTELAKLFYESDAILSAIKELIIKDEQTLKDTVITLKKKIKDDKTIVGLNDEPDLQSSYFDAMYEDEIQLVNEIHRQQRYSKLLILFVFYEDTLRKLAEFKGLKGRNNKGGLNDLEFYRNFILASCKIDSPSDMVSFYYINSQRFVRKKIAHNNGVYNITESHNFTKQEGIEQLESGNECILKISDPVYLTNLAEQIKINLTAIMYSLDKTS
jgi:hypothetical protein